MSDALVQRIAAVLREHLLGVVSDATTRDDVPADEFDCCAQAVIDMLWPTPKPDPCFWTHYHPYDDPEGCTIESSVCGGKQPKADCT